MAARNSGFDNQPSLLLDKQENDILFDVIGPRCTVCVVLFLLRNLSVVEMNVCRGCFVDAGIGGGASPVCGFRQPTAMEAATLRNRMLHQGQL